MIISGLTLREIIEKYSLTDDDLEVAESVASTRRPLVLFRGKPITTEQTMHLITSLEPLFADEESGNSFWDKREERGLLKNIFYRPGYSWLDTWIHVDGTIGGNIISLVKYPEIEEYVPMYESLSKFEFLDMIIAYTILEECSCCYCDVFWDHNKDDIESESLILSCTDCKAYIQKIIAYNKLEYRKDFTFEEKYYRNWFMHHVRLDVYQDVEAVLWIHAGKIEILTGKKAKGKFIEYNKLYSSPEYEYMFSSDIHDYNETCICNKKYIEDCFEFIGKPRTLVDEYIKRKFISPFNENAKVVTKAWMIEQYEKYIKPSQV